MLRRPEALLKPRKIKIFLEKYPDEETAEIAFSLLEKVAAAIVRIIGKDGFNALYARSLSLTAPTFPWLAASVMTLQDDDMLVLIKTSFVVQPPAEIRAASSLLLTTFSDILCRLVGDQLTARILHDAFGGDIVEALMGDHYES
jgi:hypothetical protein